MARVTRPVPSDPRELVEIAWRRRWVVLVPILLIGGAAGFLAKTLPGVYRSSTVILVEKPKVPEAYVRSTVTTRIEDRLATITQQILSRTRLEAIIAQFDLYPEERAARPMEAIIERMRGAIEVTVRGDHAFTIAFRGRDPGTVRDVTNELAAVFIDANSKVREEQAASTSEFLENQLEALKATLAEQERQVRDFKERYMGELPQQQEANLRALDRLQLQSQSIADQIRATQERRLILQAQLAQIPRVNETLVHVPTRALPGGASAGRPIAVSGSARPGSPDPLLARLAEARSTLAQMQARYTDRHPDVIRARRQIEELEQMAGGVLAPAGEPAADGARGVAPDGAGGDAGSVFVTEIRRLPNPAYREVELQVEAAGREIEALRESQQQIAGQIRTVQRKVENVPKLEQQIMELTRDYDNTRRTYETLLSKKLEAQLAENLEKRQKGEQFRVLDPANLPERPYRPNRRLILLAGLLMGLGAGAAGAAGLEVLDDAIRRPAEIRTLAPRLGLLGTIPFFTDRRSAFRRRIARAGAAGLVIALGAAALALALHYQDRIAKLALFDVLLR